MADVDFSARGNAVGFMADSEIITGRKMKSRGGTGDWVIEVGEHGLQMMNGLRRMFPRKADVIAYATSLIDAEQTTKLAWWD